MSKISRRALAHWAADQLSAGKSAADVAKHIAAVLKQSKSGNQLDFLINDIAWELEQRQTLVVGKITSAHPISKQLESDIKSQLKKTTKSTTVTIENIVDKSVLGGARVETAQHVWDQTVSRKLAELREVF
jgi:F-type H+-transporting ATPase subunit delta